MGRLVWFPTSHPLLVYEVGNQTRKKGGEREEWKRRGREEERQERTGRRRKKKQEQRKGGGRLGGRVAGVGAESKGCIVMGETGGPMPDGAETRDAAEGENVIVEARVGRER